MRIAQAISMFSIDLDDLSGAPARRLLALHLAGVHAFATAMRWSASAR
jgi:hypothetical protein